MVKSEETGICNIRGQLEFQRFKGHKYVEEKKQKQSSYVPQGTVEGFQGESSNDSKTISAVLTQTEKRKRISIQFKHNDVKHGREKSQSDSGVVPTNRESCKKDHYFENDGTGGKMVRHSFAIQKDKLRKKKEKTELSKLKARVEQTMLEKFKMQIIEDLHAARIDKKMALPVVQTCGELTSMEIDLPEENADIPAATTTSGLNLLIVIDTNIMISHLQFIMTLKTRDIPGTGRLALIIPWVVLQELDNLKKGKVLQHVRHKAVPAVEFIYTCLKNQDSKLWGQSMQLASQKIYGLSDENNDDRVLQCCLQYRSLFPQAFVILCTDDKNLCSKALVSDVKALCKADLVSALQNLNVNSHQNCVGLQQSKTDTGSQKTKKEDLSLTTPLLSIVPDLEKSLGEALSSILETEMKIAFGNLWMEVLYLKPPWTLASLLQCFKKHWMAVFGYIVPRSLLATIECLHEHLCKGKTVDHITANILLQESKKLLHAFSSRSDYDGVLPQAFAYVTKLLQMLAEIQGFGSVVTYANCTEIFQKLDHNIITTTTAKISSFEEAFLGLQKLMAAVNNILAGIRRERLTVGCCQLAQLEYTITQCNASVHMEAKNRGWL
ncbi:Transcriptional protein SWT1 [Chelonia mydas]|uniref:Transcriptional protein SWT1 n=1 Tax=Chelonia mydas TaxID=8469 RepID=M7CDF1_CHEMY|nr:Transcriptional protein SWT1 [Chelonia mydas]